jgi:hypothetical protein
VRDRLDLVSFLSRLGKPGEFDAGQGGVARRWYVGNLVHTDLQNDQADWIWTKPLTDGRWVPLHALVSGTLSVELLDAATQAQAWTSKVAVVAATEIHQTTAGRVRFRSSHPAAEIWVDGTRLGQGSEVQGDLLTGRHRVILRLDPRTAMAPLRLEVEGAACVLD